MKAFLLCLLMLSANGIAICAENESGREAVETAIAGTLSKPRYAWRTVFERHWDRVGTNVNKTASSAYLYRGETDTVRHYAVVQTSVQQMLFMRQDSEEPALLVFHQQEAVARFDHRWYTAREIYDSYGSDLLQKEEARGWTVHCSLSVPAPHRILPVLCNYLSNFREEDGAVVADIIPSDLGDLMAQRIIEPQPLLNHDIPERVPSLPARLIGRVPMPTPRPPVTPEESRRRMNEKYQTGAGIARFWLRDGQLEKYELTLSPTLALAAKDLELKIAKQLTITTEFREDPTEIEVPSEAVAMLGGTL